MPPQEKKALAKNQGNYEDALVEYRKGLAISLKVHGDQHPDTATFDINIGAVLNKQGNYEDALVEYRKVLPIFLNCFGDTHSKQ
jgi:tetratricopeptide (TPR) repeat protein